MPRTIVIIGASFAGLGVAQYIEPRAEGADVEVVLIDKKPYHEFHALLYEVATGAAHGRAEDCEKILASGVCLNLNAFDRLLRGRHMTFRCDEVVAIDRLTRKLRLRGGDTIAYDALVLAVGSETAYYGIPGLKEHAIPLKSVRDALRIRRRVLECMDRAKRGTEQKISIVIGGGGATGVEFAAELANYLRTLVATGDIRSHDYEIALIERGSRLLAAFPVRLARVTLQRLHRLGVRVLLDTVVERVELGRVLVAPRPLQPNEERTQLLCGFDGSTCTLEADLIVWTGGIQYPALPKEAGFPCDARGRVIVGEDFIVQGETCVFSLGDCASFMHPKTKQPLPPLASTATREAPLVGANVLACIDEYPLRRFRPPTLPAIVPLGGKFAGLAYKEWTWVGRFPWLLRTLVDLRYFCGVLGLVTGFRMWWRGARMYVQND
ncbi:MAG: NAD(P)/FAD-dependent oxidoreductase [bacterium]|nr:NAD(P)/FAD-dependent oxidoreductase [bacterium]